MRQLYLLSVASAFIVGCASEPGGLQDTATTPEIDTSSPCTDDIEIGRCGLADTLDECAGIEGEEHVFVPLESGDPVAIITGFQGARMFALAARTSGIEPGDPSTPPTDADPLVDAAVRRTEFSTVGRYRGWMAFVEDPEDATRHMNLEIYVLLESENPVETGQELVAEVRIADANGTQRCGTSTFTAE